MWHPMPVDETNPNGRWLVHDRKTDGYLSSNGTSGGALHFESEEEAFDVAELLNQVQAA